MGGGGTHLSSGIEFHGVGTGTVVNNIQVHTGRWDGVEIRGGAVNAKHLVLTKILDASIKIQDEYQGNLQHILVQQSNSIDEAFAADAGASKPTIANMTIVASTVLQGYVMTWAGGAGGFFHNMAISVGGDSLRELRRMRWHHR